MARRWSNNQPYILLAKKETKNKTKPFVDFFFSKELAEILVTKGKFPSTNPEVDNNLGENRKFMWLGWDYINNQNIGSLLRKCEILFKDTI